MTPYRNRELSIVLLASGVTVAIGALFTRPSAPPMGLIVLAAVLVVAGILTADLRGPDDPV